MSTEKSKISEIITKTKKRDNPVLLRFQNGEFTSDSQDVAYFKASDTRGDQKLAVVATSTNLYRGAINEDFSSSLVNKFLAIKNKRTGKVRIIEIDEASLLNDLYYKNDAKITNALSSDAVLNRLIKNFGGRQANRALERNERMKISVDVVKHQLEKTVDASMLGDDDDDQEEAGAINKANIDRIRPPFNADAKKLEDVFKLNEIIPQELFDKMNEEAKAILATEPKELPIQSEYLLGKIEEIQNSTAPDSTSNLTSLKVFVYMDALQNLIKSKEKKLNKAKLSDITEQVEKDIRVRFSEPNMASLLRTRYTKDKAICYYLALAMITSPNYEMNLNTLAQELSMSRPNIVKFAQLVNAKPIAKSDILSLRLPSKVKIATVFRRKPKTK